MIARGESDGTKRYTMFLFFFEEFWDSSKATPTVAIIVTVMFHRFLVLCRSSSIFLSFYFYPVSHRTGKIDVAASSFSFYTILSLCLLSVISLVCIGLVLFYRISTILGYLMPNPFYTYKKLYLKRFSLALVRRLNVKTVLFQIIQFCQPN